MQEFVSIVVPTRNCEKTIEKVVDSLLNLNYKKYEIIVVDSSIDGTKEVLKKYGSKIKVFHSPVLNRRTSNLQRNIGARKARGQIILFTDGDCIVDKNWISGILKGFSSKDVAIVGGSVLKWGDSAYLDYAESGIRPLIRNYQKRIIIDLSNYHKSLYPIGGNFAIRKNILKEAGWFDEDTPSFDEIELSWRVLLKGYKIVCIPNAIVRYCFVNNLSTFLKRYFKYGKGFGYFARKYPSSPVTKRKSFFISIILLLLILHAFLIYKFLTTFNSSFGILLVAPTLVLFGIHLFRSVKYRKLSLIYHLFFDILVAFMYMLGMIISLIKYRRLKK